MSAVSVIFNYIDHVFSQHPRVCTFSMLLQTWMKTQFVRLVVCIIVTSRSSVILFVKKYLSLLDMDILVILFMSAQLLC